MKMINRRLVGYSMIVLLSCLGFCLLSRYCNDTGRTSWIPLFFLLYLFIIFLSAFLISRRDEYHNYYGFSYHFVTYLIANAVPILLALAKVLPAGTIPSVLFVMAVWGIGVLFHLCMYLFIFRKRTIRQYDKEDVFK